ncbi:MAG: hypothetical protein ABJD13_04335 [Paracoccaceae bacterium]
MHDSQLCGQIDLGFYTLDDAALLRNCGMSVAALQFKSLTEGK